MQENEYNSRTGEHDPPNQSSQGSIGGRSEAYSRSQDYKKHLERMETDEAYKRNFLWSEAEAERIDKLHNQPK